MIVNGYIKLICITH